MPFSKAQALALMLLALLVAGALGASALTADPLWHDEYRSFYYAGWGNEGVTSPAGTLERVGGSDVQAPAYFMALNLWGYLAGRGVFAARVFSWLAGLLAVAVTYRLGADLAGRATGLAAALLLGVSAFFVMYLHEARTYSLLVAVVVLALVAYWRLAHGRGGPAAWVLLGASLALLPYMHYMGALLYPVLGAYHLIMARRVRRWWAVLGVMVGAGALFLPWFRLALAATTARVTGDNSLVQTFGFVGSLREVGAAFSNQSTVLLAALLVLAVFRLQAAGARYALAVTGLLFGTIVAFDAVVPTLYHPRYLLLLWGPLAVAAALGLKTLAATGWRVPLVVLALWSLAGIRLSLQDDFRLNIHGPGAYAAWDTTAAALEGRAQPDDRVLMHLPPLTIYEPYHEPVARYYLGDLRVGSAGVESLRIMPDADYIARGLDRARGAARLWYAYWPGQVPERHGVFERALAEEWVHCTTPQDDQIVDSAALHLDLFVPPPPAEAVTGQFGQGVGLAALYNTDGTYADTLPTVIGWQVADNVPPHTYSVALHLTDATGRLVRQQDYGLPGAGVACRAADLALRDLPAGRYALRASVYAWETGERLPVTQGEADDDDRIILGWITKS